MTCREFAEFLDSYLERSLSGAELAEFERHLVVCKACTAYLDTYRKTIELGRAAFAESKEALPPQVPDELIRAILAARRKR